MENRESEVLEFKKSTSELREGIISLCSMLNKNKYGTLYFGIKNDGEVVGQQIGTNTTSDISREIRTNIKPRITPIIKIIKIDDKKIIQIEVYGESTPYSAYGRYYIRSDDEDLLMTNEQLESYFLNRNYDYSKWEKEDSGHSLEEVDEELLIKYIKEGNDGGRINFIYKDAKTTLLKLDLLNGDNLNNAGYYLFSNKKPLLLKLATYPTDERISFSDMKHFKGNIFECISEAIKYISNNIKWSAQIIGTTRVETPEVPLEALREIVVNSFAHMRINPSSSNEIYITPTRIHIYNPGSLVPGTDPYKFASGETGSMIRNPLIVSVLYYNKTIDAFGTGFERVFKLCSKDSYRYENTSYGFTFEFIRKNEYLSVTKDISFEYQPLSNNEMIVLDLIKENKKYRKEDIAKLTNKSVATVSRIISSLTKQDLIERVGSNKTGYWIIK